MRRHWSPRQTYPVEHLLRSLGSALSPSLGSEGFLAVLHLDQRMTGFAADRFSRMPFTANLPDGSNGGLDEASFLGDRLWMLLYGRYYQLSLGSIHRSTGSTTNHPLPLNGNSRLYAFESGFFLPFHDPLSFYFLPRERVDPTYVQPAPIPAPLVALRPTPPR